MKKTFLTMALAATLMTGGLNLFADNTNCNNGCANTENCQPCDTTTNTPLVKQVYNKAKDGTVQVYDKVADGTVKTYDKVADGTVQTYDKVADGTVKAYDKTKNAVEKGANTVKEEWNKIF